MYTKDEVEERLTEFEGYPSMLEEAVSKLDKGITTNSNNISDIHIDMSTMVEAFENRIVGVENGLNEKVDKDEVYTKDELDNMSSSVRVAMSLEPNEDGWLDYVADKSASEIYQIYNLSNN